MEIISEVQSTRLLLTQCVDKLSSMENQDTYRQYLSDFREIPKEYFDKLKCFYIKHPRDILLTLGDELFYNQKLGFFPKTQMFIERFIIPAYTIDGLVAGLICYDNLSEYKYILSETLGFKKNIIPYGMNSYENILRNDYLILVEGVMDYIRLWSLGYPVISVQGIHVSQTLKTIISRLKGIIVISDSDSTGKKAKLNWLKLHEKATAVNIQGVKDIDDALKSQENVDAFKCIVNDILREWDLNICNNKIFIVK